MPGAARTGVPGAAASPAGARRPVHLEYTALRQNITGLVMQRSGPLTLPPRASTQASYLTNHHRHHN